MEHREIFNHAQEGFTKPHKYFCTGLCNCCHTETVGVAISNNGSVRTGLGSGKAIFRNTFTGLASALILPQVTASSGLAPESEPSDSWAVFTYTAKSAPFLCRDVNQHYKLNRTQLDFIFLVSSIHWHTALVSLLFTHNYWGKKNIFVLFIPIYCWKEK